MYWHDTVRPFFSEFDGENLDHFLQRHGPLNLKAKIYAAGHFSLKLKVSTSTLMDFTLKVYGKNHVQGCPLITPLRHSIIGFQKKLFAEINEIDFQDLNCGLILRKTLRI
jgi:hypothetical protein